MAPSQKKKKFTIYLYPETIKQIEDLYQEDSCKSMSSFVEKATRFYIGHLTAQSETSYLPNAFLSSMRAMVMDSENRQNRHLFKIAVEMAMIMNILAASQDIDSLSLNRLRGECVREVKRLNGSFTFEDAVEWQK